MRYAVWVSELNVTERWLPVVGYPYYQASDQGRVRSIDRVVVNINGVPKRLAGRILKQIPDPSRENRPHVCLYRDTVPTVRDVSCIVLEAFTGQRPPGMECCHENGDPLDNRAGNLYWGTRSQNMYDRVRHGNDPHRNLESCPREHLLVSPNLVACKERLGHRSCLACCRAQSNVKRARERGVKMDFRARSDWHYERIMRSCLDSSLPCFSYGSL